jgi:hypothetical protein
MTLDTIDHISSSEAEDKVQKETGAHQQNQHRRSSKWGIFFIVAPFVLLIFVLFAFAVVSFVSAQLDTVPIDGSVTGLSKRSNLIVVMSLLRVMLGILGNVAVIGVIVGIPIGIILLLRRSFTPNGHHDERSGKGKLSEVPVEIQRWNWGAAGLTFIWGATHRVWISLITLIPVVGLIWWIVMGVKGSEWAWRAQHWESVDAFIAYQKKWKPWGIVFFILWALTLILFILGS